jgi:predicted nucleic acid-binding protein
VKAVDSSVVIAAFASWHEHHAIARKAMAARPRLIAHAAVESYSVLTRLPPPHRASPQIVHAFITERFTEPFLILSETGYQELLATVAGRQILGGPAYDALIAFTAAEHNAILMSLDQRAAATYETVGAQVEQLLSLLLRPAHRRCLAAEHGLGQAGRGEVPDEPAARVHVRGDGGQRLLCPVVRLPPQRDIRMDERGPRGVHLVEGGPLR